MTNSQTRAHSDRPLRHAIVAGASIAGLLAARVLSEHFDRVTLIERDPVDGHAEPRTGVPQGRHLHAMLVRGLSIVEGLFPGLTDELRASGATLINAGRELGWHHAGGWRARHKGNLDFLSMTRPLLKSHIAKRVRSLPNVAIRDEVRVAGLSSDVTGKVNGLRVHAMHERGNEICIEADLVVDAMGRGSPILRWIEELGFPKAETKLLPARVAYASCMFERPAVAPERAALLITGAPARRSGGIFPIEGERRLMTLIGFFDEIMPKTHEEFLAYARSLPDDALWDCVRGSKPVSDIVSFRFIGSQRRFFERLRHHPGGLIAIGDAVCSFNPVYGQGMTVSAMEAEALGAMLSEAKTVTFNSTFVKSWYGRIAPIVDGAWNGVSIEDLRFPELAHQRPLKIRPLQWYMWQVHRATHRSPQVTAQFYRVMNFLAPPTSLFRPRIIADVLFGGIGRKAAREPQTRREQFPVHSPALARARARKRPSNGS